MPLQREGGVRARDWSARDWLCLRGLGEPVILRLSGSVIVSAGGDVWIRR